MAIASLFRTLLTMMALAAGTILFTSPAEAAEPPSPVESRFDTGLDGWTVDGYGELGDPASGYPRHETTGGNPGGFARTIDGGLGRTMYWKAPAKFLGERSAFYGGTLSFDLKQSATDNPYDFKEVVLTGGGLKLTFDLPHPRTQWTSYKVVLRPSAGWEKSTVGAPTEQEMRAVLGNLQALQIRAEYRSGADIDDLDNVVLANERPTISEIAEQTIQEDSDTGALSFIVGDAESASNDLVLAGRSSNLDLVPEDSITFGGAGANRTVTVTPAKDKFGEAQITVNVSDGEFSNEESFLLKVNPVNDAPVAKEGSLTTDEDTAKAVVLEASDVEGEPLTYTLVRGPIHGTLSGAAPNLAYTPAENYEGPDSLTFKATDGEAESAEATVSIEVNPVNDAPVANNDAYSVDEDQTLNVGTPGLLGNDTDVEHDALHVADSNTTTLTIDPVSGPSHGTLNLNANGSFSYTPEPNFNGTDEFAYKTNDGADDSNVATASITIKSVNDPPVALPDFIMVAEDDEKNFDATMNDQKGPANESTQTLSVDSIVAQANHGTATTNPDGIIKYVPNANYNGPDSFIYKVCDDGKTSGSLDSKCSIAPVNVNVTPVNDAPVADNDAYPVDEDQTLTIAPPGVLGNDTDVEHDALHVADNDAGTPEIDPVSGPSHGTVNLNANGSFTYTPDADYNGPDSFTYKVSDGTADSNAITVNITVKAVNDAPVAKDLTGDDSQVTTPEDTAKGITLEASDIDSRDLTFTTTREPTHGTLSGAGANPTYSPNKDFNGSDSFTFEVCDDGQPQQCDQATVEILVTAVTDDPVATADEYTVNEDTPITVNAATGVLHNDTDLDGDSLKAELISGPEHGTLTLNPDGSFTYTPAANYTGSDTFTYKAIDPSNGEASATVIVTITATNDDPVANDDSGTTDEDTPLTIDVGANDSDVDGDILSISEFTQPQNGTVTNVEGKLRYVPKDNYHGPDTFTYTVSDGKGGTATAQVSIMVNAVNDLPVANADNISVGEDGEQIFDPTLNDSTGPADEADQMLKVDSIATPPTHGTATLIISGPDAGKLSYRPAADLNGSDSFTYKVCDNGETNGRPDAKCATAKVTVTITPVNDGPKASADAYNVDEDKTLTIVGRGVLDNDQDVDGDILTATLVTGADHGQLTLNPNGSFSYTPDPDYNGADEFIYKANDGSLDSGNVTVHIDVNPVNDEPVAKHNSVETNEDTSKQITLSASDVENDSLSYKVTSLPANGKLYKGDSTLAADEITSANTSLDGAQVTYAPDTNYNGPDSFKFLANDGIHDGNEAAVNITVLMVEKADGTPPATTATTSREPNAAGWYKEDVSVTLSAIDDVSDSGVEEISYTIGGGEPTVVPGDTAQIDVRTEGQTTIAYHATDAAGNAEEEKNLTIRLDKTAPSITDSGPTSQPNANGWYNTPVTNTFSASDKANGSGLSDSGQHELTQSSGSTEGSAVTINSGPVSDVAGNTNPGIDSRAFKIDATEPTLDPSVSPNPVVLKGSATATPGADDKLSGVVSASCNPVDTSSVGSKSVSCSAEDRAGNTAKGDAVYSVVYDWTGFFRPVDNRDVDGNYIVNVANAGSAIPVKFSLSGDQSLDIFATAADGTSYPKSGVTACDPTAKFDTIEQTVVASASGLTYDASIDQYTYVWKTGNAWAGSCRQLVVKLNDGTVHRAYFKFK